MIFKRTKHLIFHDLLSDPVRVVGNVSVAAGFQACAAEEIKAAKTGNAVLHRPLTVVVLNSSVAAGISGAGVTRRAWSPFVRSQAQDLVCQVVYAHRGRVHTHVGLLRKCFVGAKISAATCTVGTLVRHIMRFVYKFNVVTSLF